MSDESLHDDDIHEVSKQGLTTHTPLRNTQDDLDQGETLQGLGGELAGDDLHGSGEPIVVFPTTPPSAGLPRSVEVESLQFRFALLLKWAKRSRFFICLCLILVVCGISILLISQTANLIALFLSSPGGLAFAGLGALVVLLGFLLFAATRLAIALIRLPQSPSLSLAAIHDIDAVRSSSARNREVDRVARQYLDKFQFDNEIDVILRRFDVDPKLLQKNRERLVSNRSQDTQGWVEDFYRLFLTHLDQASDAAIRSSRKQVFWQTAASPWGKFDALLVLYHSWRLTYLICRLYGLRPSPLAIAFILGFAGSHSFLSSKLDEGADAMAEALSEDLSDFVGSTLLSKFTAKLGTKVAEGTANQFCLYILGQGVKRVVRPPAVT